MSKLGHYQVGCHAMDVFRCFQVELFALRLREFRFAPLLLISSACLCWHSGVKQVYHSALPLASLLLRRETHHSKRAAPHLTEVMSQLYDPVLVG